MNFNFDWVSVGIGAGLTLAYQNGAFDGLLMNVYGVFDTILFSLGI